MTEDAMKYDPRYWHNITPPRMMDVSRRFEYDQDALDLLQKWLGLTEGTDKSIVEAGCGSGYFTRLLLKMSPRSKIIAVEPDNVLMNYAKQKMRLRVRFVKGTVERIPLSSGIADQTCCHIVLCNLPDVHRAVAEMIRVTKNRGLVAAIEPCGGGAQYFPDQKIIELEKKGAQTAFGKGIWDLRGKLIDYSKDVENKQARYPELFSSCGLSNVEAHGLLSVVLLSDPRRKKEEVLEWMKKRLTTYKKDKERLNVILDRGGLPDSLIKEYHLAWERYLENIANNPEEIPKTHELQAVGRIITIGHKSEKL